MLDFAAPALRSFGVRVQDLEVIARMCERRVTQADMVLHMAQAYEEPLALGAALVSAFQNEEIFERYLAKAEPLPVLSPENPIKFHISRLGGGRPIGRLAADLGMPLALVEDILEPYLREGTVRAIDHPELGRLYRRSSKGPGPTEKSNAG
jgi:hypothetical protein